MNKIFEISLSSCIFIVLSSCSDKPKENSPMPSDKRGERPSTAHRVSNYTVEIKKEDWEYIATFTDTLVSGDRKRILDAFSELRMKSDSGFHLGLIFNTIMKKGTPDQRALADNFISALCKVAEGSENTELFLAHPCLVGTTQTIFEAAGANGPGSIPPAKNVLEWWKSSKVRSLLLAK